MKKNELIQQIAILDNVLLIDKLDLSKMKKKDLENLYQKICDHANKRQNAWERAYSKSSNKE